MADFQNQRTTGPFPTPAPGPPTTGTRRPGRIVVFSGPKEGVGKSTLCMNLALVWAGSQSRNVIIVHMDPLCRQDVSYFLGLEPPSLASLSQVVGKEGAVLAKLLKGRIPISSWGVGTLPLGHKRADILTLSAETIMSILTALSESYDLFIDVDPDFPMQVFSFDLADVVYWVSLPQRAHFEATYNLFQELKGLHFPLDRFQIVINECNLPGALTPKDVEKFFGALGRRVLTYMPWEDLLPEFANSGRILVVEHPQSEWVKQLRTVLGDLVELKVGVKPMGSLTAAIDFGQTADMMFRPSQAGGGAAGGNQTTAIKARPLSAAGADKPAFWDELTRKVHKNVVTALEMERVRIADGSAASQDTRNQVAEVIETILQKEANLPLTRDQRARFVADLIDEILGLGPIEELMRDPGINEIMVNSPDKIYIERAGKLILTPLRFRDEEQIIQVMKRIVAPLGRRIDESVPLVDARTKDGSRVNGIIPPLAVSGPALTIRRFSQKPFTGPQLIKMGTIAPEFLEFVAACVKVKKNIIISGGTGTGKTTFLNLLSNFIPEDERIVTVEDTAELKLQQPHWVRLESRPANIEGKGEITIRDLVKNCLRMRPDRIVVGECRGAEALDMLQAMNTGHEGSLATIHSNSPRDAVSRLSAMCLMGSMDLPMFVLREMISSAVHLIVQITRFADGSRKITSISEITGRDDNQILMSEIFKFEQVSVDADSGKVIGYFTGCGRPPRFMDEFRYKGINIPIEIFRPIDPRKLGLDVPK